MTGYNLEKLDELKLDHLPNDAKLVIQKQSGGPIPEDKVQLYLATNFLNTDNGQTVWCKGFSIQIEQVPALIESLKKQCAKYDVKSEKPQRTGTFADLYMDDEE